MDVTLANDPVLGWLKATFEWEILPAHAQRTHRNSEIFWVVHVVLGGYLAKLCELFRCREFETSGSSNLEGCSRPVIRRYFEHRDRLLGTHGAADGVFW